MQPRKPPIARQRQRGVAALAVVMVLLVVMSLVVAFSSRSLLFEQRASANQLRAARALAAAESGLEWALARLNDPRRIDARCRGDAAAGLSFRERYAPALAQAGFALDAATRPGCQIGDTGLQCSCPATGQVPQLTGDAPNFTVELASVPGDAEALQVIARGCTSAARECVPGATHASDAMAVVQAQFKLLAPWATRPVAAVTAGGSAEMALGVRLRNPDAATQGRLVHAGGAANGAGLAEPAEDEPADFPAQPVRQGDPELAAAFTPRSDGVADFAWRFGQTPTQLRASPWVWTVRDCGTAGCAAQLVAAAAQGYLAFYVEGDLHLAATAATAPSLGSEARPLLVVATGRISGSGGPRVFGLIASQAVGSSLAGDIDLQGAFVARGDLHLLDGASVVYSPAVLRRLRQQAGRFVRVPGSWTDSHCASDEPAAPCGSAP